MRAKHGLIGAPVSRLDGALKVKGAARFAAEYAMEGMVYAALAYSTIAKGRIATLERRGRSGARRGAGDDVPERAADEADAAVHDRAEGGRRRRPAVMQDDRIHWNGQPIAVVLAETQEQADHARSLIARHLRGRSRGDAFEEARANPRTPAVSSGSRSRTRAATPRRRSSPRPTGSISLPDPAPEPQRDRAARGDGRLGRGRADRPRRHPGRDADTPGRSRTCSGSTRSRCM